MSFITEIESIALIFEKDMKEAANAALPITEKILSTLQSPDALVVESLIPNGATYAADAVLAINAAIPAIKLLLGVGDTSSVDGLLQRLGSTLTGIIHGGKHPFTYYVYAFEYICFGTKANIVA